jgi:acyl-CoA reductase-like NAD-dependent aldehyde dehydrogenase
MMGPAESYLDALKLAADQSSVAENEFRSQIAARIKELEKQRAFAFRRLNLMKEVSGVIASAESEEIAVAVATAVLRAKLGWASDSEARMEVVSNFAPVAQAMFASLAPVESEDEEKPDVIGKLAEFEAWYAETHPNPFWVLFENYMPETPVVDF